MRDALIAELKSESGLTKKILERVSLDKKDWKPHEKSMSLGRLATHVAEIPHWISDIINIDDFDFLARPYSSHVASSQEELMQIFNDNLERALDDLGATDIGAFDKNWTLRRGDNIIFELPKTKVIRSWGFSHLFHHRGQLSVYLRLLDIPVPGMYGPSADEKIK